MPANFATRRNAFRPQLETLENRRLMAADVVAQIDSTGNLAIAGTAGADVVNVSAAKVGVVNWVKVEANGRSQQFQAAQIKTGTVIFTGGAGNDYFRNDAGSLRTIAFGQAGNDVLIGGAQADQLVGGDGDDQLYGQGGDDQIWGEAGNDLLAGGLGNDQLMGGAGNDRLFGEAGNDALFGQEGDDTLTGGSGSDFFDGGIGITTRTDFEASLDLIAQTGLGTALWRQGKWFPY